MSVLRWCVVIVLVAATSADAAPVLQPDAPARLGKPPSFSRAFVDRTRMESAAHAQPSRDERARRSPASSDRPLAPVLFLLGAMCIGVMLYFLPSLVAMALGCRENDNVPPLPAPPDLERRVVPSPPGNGDYAHRDFASPLPLQDAEAILQHTQVFAFGDMPLKRQVQAFNVVFEQPDAVVRFQRLAGFASPAGRLYVLAGLLLLDRPAARRLQEMLDQDAQTIVVFDSDVVHRIPVRQLAGMIEQRELGTWFRRVRDETNAHYAKPR